MIVDLRSDTVTRPTEAMRAIMARAAVGDDVFGDDPTVRELESVVADRLGQARALFMPSGTMANAVAVAAQTQRGDEVLLEETAHVFQYEGGGAAAISGVQLWPIATTDGLPTPDEIGARVRPSDPHHPISRLLCLENTHNRAGGRVLPLDGFRRTVEAARSHGLRVHLDGARLWNASVASGHPEAAYAELCDSVSVCFSKGLGAPVGSALAGSEELIARARLERKRLGGGMRQAGILAAAALHAVLHHRDRLADDHRRAARLAEGIASLSGLALAGPVDTNIVVARVLRGTPAEWLGRLAEEGVLAVGFGRAAVRFVTHLDVDDDGVERALRVLRALDRGV